MTKSKNNYPLVSIVTVAFKDDKYLPKLLSSIEHLECSKLSLEIIIVSILASEKLINVKKIPVKQVRITHRVGYAEAVNMGISESQGQYLFLPNPDTLVHKTALKKMVSYLQDHNDVGIVAPKVFLMDEPSRISPFDLPCRYFNKTLGKILQVTAEELATIHKPQEVYWLCGNGIIVRKTIWEKVRKYDESFFLYWEDADFNMKVLSCGYKSVLIPQSRLFHKGFASVGDTADQVYYIVRNGRYFINKYSSFPGRFLLHLSNFLVIVSKSFQLFFGTRDRMKTQAFIDGIIDFYRGRRGMRKIRIPNIEARNGSASSPS